MNDSKMYQVQPRLEYKYSCPHSHERVYMPPMQCQKTKSNKATIYLKKILCFTQDILIAITIANMVSLALKPIAYKERGYFSYGGEMLVIIAVFVLIWWLLTSKRQRGCKK